MLRLIESSPKFRHVCNWLIIASSVLVCLLVLPTRLPGAELLGIQPNWLLMWVVVWSAKRSPWEGAIAGIVLGLIYDSLTALDNVAVIDGVMPLASDTIPLLESPLSYPSHVISLVLVGIFTAKIQRQRFIQEDFIFIALIVFVMCILAETITALQYSLQGIRSLAMIWTEHQRIALSSALLSSLWAPVLYYPLNRWWQYMRNLDQMA